MLPLQYYDIVQETITDTSMQTILISSICRQPTYLPVIGLLDAFAVRLGKLALTVAGCDG